VPVESGSALSRGGKIHPPLPGPRAKREKDLPERIKGENISM